MMPTSLGRMEISWSKFEVGRAPFAQDTRLAGWMRQHVSSFAVNESSFKRRYSFELFEDLLTLLGGRKKEWRE
jgi:hypothetical protein